jgi:alkylated DNA repair protein alkB homolog 1
MHDAAIPGDESIVDFQRGLNATQRQAIQPVYAIPAAQVRAACQRFRDMEPSNPNQILSSMDDAQPCTVYEHSDFPGIAPNKAN